MSVVLKYQCPRCTYYCDAASSPIDDMAQPEPGSLGLCLVCAAPLCYAATEPPRWLTFQEVAALPAEAKAEMARVAFAILTHRPSRVVLTRAGTDGR